jgi:hypothetical protein
MHMLETKTPFAVGLVLAMLAAAGCYDFDAVFDDCVKAGRCQPTNCDPSAVDLPDDLFHDANCDGVDGTLGDALFVDPAAGQDSNPGTREAPLKHLSSALKLAATQGKALYLAQGTYDEAELRMDKPVSLHGGYSGVDGNWKRGAEHTTRIGGGSIGFTVKGLADAGVVIEWVRIGSTTSTVPGAPSIGLRVMDSSNVRLRHVQVEAGAGSAGRAGDSPGTNPQAGANGGVGQSINDSSTTPAGGPRGERSCGPGSYRGGAGGQGGTFNPPATAGEAGEPAAGGGTAGTNTSHSCSTETQCQCTGGAGGPGQPGGAGGAGKDGQPGDGTGLLESDTWVARSGTDGETGTVGEGGGGGGGGGYCQLNSFKTQSKGGGGGGGGAGGCPGAGAKGGQGGGASIAVLLIRGHVELESSTLKTAGGGQGGRGGTGGHGSAGGQGGAGGQGIRQEADGFNDNNQPMHMISTGGTGGTGGKGGDGGRGGHGGNGGGGPSVGVWCGPESSVSQTGTTFSLGDPGQPGAGPLPEGNTGLLFNLHQCS